VVGDRRQAFALGVDYLQIFLAMKQAKRDQKMKPYTDLALTPVQDDETDTLELFTHNDGARNEVVRLRKIAALTHGEHVEAAT